MDVVSSTKDEDPEILSGGKPFVIDLVLKQTGSFEERGPLSLWHQPQGDVGVATGNGPPAIRSQDDQP